MGSVELLFSKTVRCSSTSGTPSTRSTPATASWSSPSSRNLEPVRSSVEADSGRYVYSLNTPARPGFTGDRFARDDLRSRWQAQLGVRYSFGR